MNNLKATIEKGADVADTPKQNERPRSDSFTLTVVVACGLAIGYGLLTRLIFGANFASELLSTLSVGFLCFVPVAVGAITVFVRSRTEYMSWGKSIGAPILPSLIFLVSVILFNLEAGICIVMASPLFFGVASIGGLVMHWILKIGSKSSVNSAVAALLVAPYLIASVEGQIPVEDSIRHVPTQIVINAPVEVVWENIVRVPEIRAEERSTRFSHLIGVPQPVEAILSFEGVGGVRDASFANGLVFIETITEWTPMETVSFTIEPVTPETMPPPFNMIGGSTFDVIDGTYRIEPISEDQVILHLSSTHRLSSSINAYGGLWTDYIMADLQNYILEIIKTRCEAQA